MQNQEIIQRLVAQAKQLQLTRLDLSDHRLSYFPEEILELKQLQTLDLHDNQITELPASIYKLTQLSRLDLSHNQLKTLPASLGKLQQLQVLNLGHNAFEAYPEVLAQFQRLQVLNLRHNQIKHLPAHIIKLSLLQELYLGNNLIEDMPIELTELGQLRCLDLAHNKLLKLPTEIGRFVQENRLKPLKRLYLQNNPLPIPPEILIKFNHPQAITHYYLQVTAQMENKQPLNEAKILLVGEGGVGKTSVSKRLLYKEYDANESKTEGIHIDHWYVPFNEHNLRLNVWDFGGQEIMHATHQFFLTKRSVYLLVLDARRDEGGNRVEYWLKLIQSFGGESPVIIVINKIDQQAFSLNRTGLQAKYPSIMGYCEISCRDNTGLDALKGSILNAVRILPHVFDPFPSTWLQIKNELENLDVDFLPYQDYVEICQRHEVSDRISQQTLIGFLHDLGIALNFYDDARLQDTNILNPEWLTNGVYTLLNNNLLFKNKGVFDYEDLNIILDPERYPASRHDFLVSLMRKFELCFPFAQGEYYLIPDLLPKEEPDLGWEQMAEEDDFLAFEYHYDVLPNSVFSRFLVRLYTLVSKRTYWRTGVILAYENNKALIKADIEDCFISIKVMGHPSTRRVLLGMIRQNFEHIHSTIKQIKVEEKVPYQGVLIGYRHLLTLEQANETHFIPEGLQHKVSVRRLLAGIEDQDLRYPNREAPQPKSKTLDDDAVIAEDSLLKQDPSHKSAPWFNNLFKAASMSALTMMILLITQQFLMPLPPALVQAVVMLLIVALLGLVVSYRGFITTLMGGILIIVIVSSFAALKGGIGEKSLLELMKMTLSQVGVLAGGKPTASKKPEKKAPDKIELQRILKGLISTLQVSATPKGVQVSLSDVLFDSGQARLRTQAFRDLMKLANILNQHRSYRLIIEGHTDNLGDPKSNLQLSEQRAAAVFEVLSLQGVAPERMKVKGYGQKRPIAKNNTKEGRQQNRRVEIIIQPDATTGKKP